MTSMTSNPPSALYPRRDSLSHSIASTDISDSPSLYDLSDNDDDTALPTDGSSRLSLYGPKMRKMGMAPWELDMATDAPETGSGSSIFGKRAKGGRERSRTLVGAIAASVGSPAKDGKLKGLGFALDSRTSSDDGRRPSLTSTSPPSASSFVAKAKSSAFFTPRLRSRTFSAETSSVASLESLSAILASAPPPRHQMDPLDRTRSNHPISIATSLHPEDMFKRLDNRPESTLYSSHLHPYANPDSQGSFFSDSSSTDPSPTHSNPSPVSFIHNHSPVSPDLSQETIHSPPPRSMSPTAPLKVLRKKPPPPLTLTVPRSDSATTLTQAGTHQPSPTSDSSQSSGNSLKGAATKGHRVPVPALNEGGDQGDLTTGRRHPYASNKSAGSNPVAPNNLIQNSNHSNYRTHLSPIYPTFDRTPNQSLPPSPAPTSHSGYLSPSPAAPSSTTFSSLNTSPGPPSPFSPMFQSHQPNSPAVEGIPTGMLSFPGSPAFNLISLEQAQAKVKGQGPTKYGDGKHSSGLGIRPGNSPMPLSNSGRLRSVSAGGALGATDHVTPSEDMPTARPTVRTRTKTEASLAPTPKESHLEPWTPPFLAYGTNANSRANSSTTIIQQRSAQVLSSDFSENAFVGLGHASPSTHSPAPVKTLRQRKSGFLKLFNKDGQKSHSTSATTSMISSPVESTFNRLPTPNMPAGFPPSPHPSTMPSSLPRPTNNLPRSGLSNTTPALPPSSQQVSSLDMENSSSSGSDKVSRSRKTPPKIHSKGSTEPSRTQGGTGQPTTPKKSFESPTNPLPKLRPMSSAFSNGLPAEFLLSSSPRLGSLEIAQPHFGGNSRSGYGNVTFMSPTTPSFSSIASLSATSSTFSTSSGSSSSLPTSSNQPRTQSLGSGFDSIPEGEDPGAIIAALQEQLVSARKGYQIQMLEMENQIKGLKREVEELKKVNGECTRCSSTLDVEEPDRRGSGESGVLHRPRARTGTGSRFGSSWEA